MGLKLNFATLAVMVRLSNIWAWRKEWKKYPFDYGVIRNLPDMLSSFPRISLVRP